MPSQICRFDPDPNLRVHVKRGEVHSARVLWEASREVLRRLLAAQRPALDHGIPLKRAGKFELEL